MSARFVSCSTVAAQCEPAPPEASCVPLALDMSDPAWAGLRVDPGLATWWLSSRSWMWPLLQNAMTATRAAIVAAFGVEPFFVLTATWHEGPRPDATLTVAAPVFACDYVDAFDKAQEFLRGPESGPAPAHAAAVLALEDARFDGAAVRDVWVTAEMWAEPATASEAAQ